MSKLKVRKVWLKDSDGNTHRIFNVANPRDSKGEFYIKIMFPDLAKQAVIGAHHDSDDNITHFDNEMSNFQEFTYHYLAGVSHYKNQRDRIDVKRQLPTLKNFPIAHVLRLTLYDLEAFKPHSRFETGQDDLVIRSPFNKRLPRAFGIIVSADPDVRMFSSNDVAHIATHRMSMEDKNTHLFISDSVWFRPPITQQCSYEIFRYSDPTHSIESVPSSQHVTYTTSQDG
jgi:hypothetical protein